MKATIEFDDALYRRLKAEAALRGEKIKDLVAQGIRRVLDEPPENEEVDGTEPAKAGNKPAWFGLLRHRAETAGGRHDMDSVRASIAGMKKGSQE